MSTQFYGEGNIGSAPEFREFGNEEHEPHRLLRLNVYFDNPIPVEDGWEDRGGFWATVELWHRDAQRWSALYQTGMRVFVDGREVADRWDDSEGNPREQRKIVARRVAVLPYRIERIVLAPKPPAAPNENLPAQDPPARE